MGRRGALALHQRQNGRLLTILLRGNLRSETSSRFRDLFHVRLMRRDCFRDLAGEAFELLIGGEELKVGG